MPKDRKIIIGGNVSGDDKCGCQPVDFNESRRSLLKMAALGVAAGLTGAGATLARAAENKEESARPKPGDFLVSDKIVSAPVAIKIEDVEPENVVLTYPFDRQTGTVRSASRLNKILLIRFDESELPEDVAANAAGGVLAFSAVCTHQGCDVDTWMGGDGLLACFCHGSMFDPLQGARVISGPAPRPLPVLPIEEKDGEIVVAQGFRSSPGFN